MKKIIEKYHIKFQKDTRLKVLFSLLVQCVQEYLWKYKKRRKKLTKPVVHLYTVCWNEAKILPFMLQHYAAIVDKFIIYDNMSDDGTEELLKTYSNVDVKKFDTNGQFDEFSLQNIRNNAWKKSRGKADWV